MKPKRLLALGVLLAGVTAAASLPAAQKPAPPLPPSQTQLEQRVKELEKRLDAADQKAASAAKEEHVVTLPAVLAFLAICVSSLTLWKGHFARFSPLALAGNLQHRVYPIRNEDRRWFITSFDVPVSVTNPGARPGFVTGVRLRLHYPELPFAGNHEFIPPQCELKPDKVNSIDKNRFKWFDEVVAADWSPFVILPKATAAKHLLFEARWDKPVIQKQIVATLELQVDWRTQWLTVTEWKLTLPPQIWVDLLNGGSMTYVPDKVQFPLESESSPPDLHKHTGTKEALPTKGLVTSAEPSYLDYPESKKH